MKKTFLILLGLVGLVAVTVAILVGVFALFGGLFTGVSGGTVLEVDLERSFVEHVPEDPAAKLFLADATRLRDVVEALEKASRDEDVVGLVAKVGAGGLSMAQAQEIRDAVLRFRESGKTAVAWAETFGEVGPGNVSYYLATAFDEIWLQPSGDVGLVGFMLEGQFLDKTLEKLDVKVRFDHRHEYKNAMNTFTETDFTEAHREALLALGRSWHEQLVQGISESRDMSVGDVDALIDEGPYLGGEAVSAGLVDRVGYRDEVYEKVEGLAEGEAHLLYLKTYLERAGRPYAEGRGIALIHGTGTVMRGETTFNPLTGGFTMGSDTVSAAIRDAVAADEVEAIVFRVDSPGGSYVASDTIWREVVRARDAGKPVIVSMGALAASGGYFVAAPATKIVAQPATITGSIGVLGGKFLVRGAYNKAGITFDEVHTADNAVMYSALVDYTEHGWRRHQAWLDRVYADFTEKVAEGRDMNIEAVREVAKGRIWSGARARENGLVDELGGLVRAIELAREEAGLPEGADVRLMPFPRPKSFFESLTAEEAESSEAAAALALRRGLRALRPLVETGETLGVIETKERRELALPHPPEPAR